jgi:hypothetical protein
VNLGYLFGMWVSSLYNDSTLSICSYLSLFSRYFFLDSWSHVTPSATTWEPHYPERVSDVMLLKEGEVRL